MWACTGSPLLHFSKKSTRCRKQQRENPRKQLSNLVVKIAPGGKHHKSSVFPAIVASPACDVLMLVSSHRIPNKMAELAALNWLEMFTVTWDLTVFRLFVAQSCVATTQKKWRWCFVAACQSGINVCAKWVTFGKMLSQLLTEISRKSAFLWDSVQMIHFFVFEQFSDFVFQRSTSMWGSRHSSVPHNGFQEKVGKRQQKLWQTKVFFHIRKSWTTMMVLQTNSILMSPDNAPATIHCVIQCNVQNNFHSFTLSSGWIHIEWQFSTNLCCSEWFQKLKRSSLIHELVSCSCHCKSGCLSVNCCGSSHSVSTLLCSPHLLWQWVPSSPQTSTALLLVHLRFSLSALSFLFLGNSLWCAWVFHIDDTSLQTDCLPKTSSFLPPSHDLSLSQVCDTANAFQRGG